MYGEITRHHVTPCFEAATAHNFDFLQNEKQFSLTILLVVLGQRISQWCAFDFGCRFRFWLTLSIDAFDWQLACNLRLQLPIDDWRLTIDNLTMVVSSAIAAITACDCDCCLQLQSRLPLLIAAIVACRLLRLRLLFANCNRRYRLRLPLRLLLAIAAYCLPLAAFSVLSIWWRPCPETCQRGGWTGGAPQRTQHWQHQLGGDLADRLRQRPSNDSMSKRSLSRDLRCSLAGKSLFLPFLWDLSNPSVFMSTSSESSWGTPWRSVFEVLQISPFQHHCFRLHAIFRVLGIFGISISIRCTISPFFNQPSSTVFLQANLYWKTKVLSGSPK